ncbi:hypothetical protein Gotur_002711 [Gossypium turneri]
MSAYLTKVKHLCDSLEEYGHNVSLKEQQSVILNDLPLEFDHVVSIITTSRISFDLQGILTTLLDAESQQQGCFTLFVRRVFLVVDEVGVGMVAVLGRSVENPRMGSDNKSSNWGEPYSHMGHKPITTYMCYTNTSSSYAGGCAGPHFLHYAANPMKQSGSMCSGSLSS